MSRLLRFRRTGVAFVMLGAFLAGLGEGIRAANDSASWTDLLDAAGLVLAVAGGVFEARTADLLFDFAPRPARRRAMLLLVVGLLVIVFACVLLSAFDQPVLHGIAGGAVVLGLGFGAGGLFSLAWFYGGGYAAGRIQDRADDDS
jgi:drug/metabolite transporter (DMT)-like permease